MRTCLKPMWNILIVKLYYQQLHLQYLCNLARYWLQAPWGWHDSVETCSSVIICEITVHLVTVQKNYDKVFIKFVVNDISLDCMLSVAFMPTITLTISFRFCTTSRVAIRILLFAQGLRVGFPLSLYSICDTKDFANELLPCSIW